MMMKWYKTASDDPFAMRLSRYFLAESGPLKFGGEDLFLRSPAPESLVGAPSATLTVIARQTHQNRFAAVTLSFAPDEIDALEFNAGGKSRRLVAGAIEVFLECVFPGIPAAARPPVMVGTHVHTGRLELNLLIPKAVLTASGYRSYNPAPPGTKTQTRWDLAAAFLCAAFDWRDPNDPLNRRLVTHPDWVLKRRAEQIRAGTFDESELRWMIERSALQAYHEGADCRDQLLAELAPMLKANHYQISTTTQRSVGFKPRRGSEGETIVVKGLLFCSGHFLDALEEYGAEHDPDARRKALGTDLARALAATAQRNRTRFGFDAAAAPDPDPFALLERSPRPLPPGHPGAAVVGYEAEGRPGKSHAGSARPLDSPLGMTLVRTLTGLLRRLIRASADHLVASLITTSPFSNMKPIADRWSEMNARLSSLVARRDARGIAGSAATGGARRAAAAVPGNPVRWDAERALGADQQRPAGAMGPDRGAYRIGRKAHGRTGSPGGNAGTAGRNGAQTGASAAAPRTRDPASAMRSSATDSVSTTVMVTEWEEADVFVRDHASEVETDRAGNLNSDLGILGEVVQPDTIPDFLEPMSHDDLADWDGADESGIEPS
ncbi:MAG: hypothetical protein K9G81_16560 [Rhodobacteraceae bacterium]|nr:hypothetical protein [Paracoccaceae bacterium]